MQVAFVLFDLLTALDFVGVYDPITRLRSMSLLLPDFEWQFCALTSMVTDDRGLRLLADRVGEPLCDYDLVLVPGGFDGGSFPRAAYEAADAVLVEIRGTCRKMSWGAA
jgi:hypothetical protein